MKTIFLHRFVSSLIFFFLFLLTTNSLSAQIDSFSWSKSRAINEDQSHKMRTSSSTQGKSAFKLNVESFNGEMRVTKSTNSLATQKDVLRLANGINKNSIFKLNFEKALTEVNFSILSYYAICKGKCDLETKQLINIKGIDKVGNKIEPIYSYTSTSPESIAINGSEITVLQQAQNEIHVAFETPIVQVSVSSTKNKSDPNFFPFMELSEVSWLENSLDVEPNPTFIKEDCDKWNVVFAIDVSNSIDEEENSSIRKSILNLLSYWKINNRKKDINVAFIEFNSQADISLPFSKLTQASLSEGGIIRNYLMEKPSILNPIDGRTNWENALKSCEYIVQGLSSSILFFITDGPPNLNTKNSYFFNESREGVLRVASNLKSQGTHIYGIASGDLNKKNSKIWMGYLTNGNESQTINLHEPVNYDKLDYIAFPTFENSLNYFSELTTSCDSKTENSFIQLNVYPSPASSFLNVLVKANSDSLLGAELSLQVYDILGKTLFYTPVQANSEYEINISDFPSGIYSVLLRDSNKIVAQSKVSILK